MSGLNEPVKVLSLGSVIGGRTLANRGWSEAIRGLTRQIARHREEVDSDINVNIEFHVPGNLLRPEFEGLRTGTFRKKDSLIKVQVALPEQTPADARSLLVREIFAALDEVDVWAATRRQVLSTANLRRLIEEVAVLDG